MAERNDTGVDWSGDRSAAPACTPEERALLDALGGLDGVRRALWDAAMRGPALAVALNRALRVVLAADREHGCVILERGKGECEVCNALAEFRCGLTTKDAIRAALLCAVHTASACSHRRKGRP